MDNSFTVFISFKNSDSNGEFTRDRQLASELHRELSNAGVRTFCSLFSLQQMGSSEYKRAINKALDQSSILVVVGTQPEYITSGWVEYEWTSFHEDIISGRKPKATMITYVEGIAPNNLPRELRSGYQSIDAGVTSVRETVEFIVRCVNSLAEKSEDAIAQSNGIAPKKANFDDQLRGRFDELFGSHQGRCQDTTDDDNSDPVFALLEKSYVDNFAEWMQSEFSHGTKMALLQDEVSHSIEQSQDSVDCTVQPVQLLDSMVNPNDDEEFIGKFFTIVDKPNMRTIVYEIYKDIDYATRSQLPLVIRTVSFEIEREDGSIERTFYIPYSEFYKPYTEHVDLVFMTIGPSTQHVLMNMGKMIGNGVRISRSPTPISYTSLYTSESGEFSDQDDTSPNNLPVLAYGVEHAECNIVNRRTIEVDARISKDSPIVIDPENGEPLLRNLYYDDEGRRKARMTIAPYKGYIAFEIKGITRPLTELEMGRYYVRGIKFPHDIRKGIEHLLRDGSADALYEIACVFLREEGYRNEAALDSYLCKSARAGSVQAKALLALRMIAQCQSERADAAVQDVLTLPMPNDFLPATMLVAYCLEKGVACERDVRGAFDLYLHCAQEKNYTPAHYRLHRNWKNVDMIELQLWSDFTESVQLNDGVAEFCLGSPMLHGSCSFERDVQTALSLLGISALHGCYDAWAELDYQRQADSTVL